MNKKRIMIWEGVGAVVAMLLGVLMHFAFKWTNECRFTAGLFPVNESVWEHCKLTFIPFLEFGVLEFIFLRKRVNNFFSAKAAAATVATLLTVILYYLYTAFTGNNYMLADIIIFIVSILLGQYISYRLLTSPRLEKGCEWVSIVWIILVLGLFCYFSFNPPLLGIFMDPKGFYGIEPANAFLNR